MMDDDILDDDLAAIVDALTRDENRLNAPAYDGVLGRLPEWVPANIHEDFCARRERLLRTYSHADLLDYIAKYIAITEDTTEYSIPFDIMRDVSMLAHYQEAVRLGPVEGLALLTDPEYARLVTLGKKFLGRKPGSYAPWKKWIEQKLKNNINLKPAALWELFKANPRRGWRAVESAKLGRYLESPTGSDDDVTYKRFQDAVGEVRRNLKKG